MTEDMLKEQMKTMKDKKGMDKDMQEAIRLAMELDKKEEEEQMKLALEASQMQEEQIKKKIQEEEDEEMKMIQ